VFEAHCQRYPALYDPDSGVIFSHGRAEVTEEQAFALANRRYVDGILINGQPAKEWARDRRREPDQQDSPSESGQASTVEATAVAPKKPRSK